MTQSSFGGFVVKDRSCSGSWWFISACVAQALGRHVSFRSCGSRALEHSLGSCGALGLVALWHVPSSWIKDQTRVSFIGRWILYH